MSNLTKQGVRDLSGGKQPNGRRRNEDDCISGEPHVWHHAVLCGGCAAEDYGDLTGRCKHYDECRRCGRKRERTGER